MKFNPRKQIILFTIMFLSACGPAATADVAPVVEEAPASPTTGLAASATSLPATLTPLPSITSTMDPTQILLEKRQQDILTYLVTPIDAAISANGGDWFILVQELGGELLYSRQADSTIWVDNMIHLPFSMLLLKSLENYGITEIKVYLSNLRDYETSLRQTLFEMLVYGNETSATRVMRTIPQYGLNISETMQSWNAGDTIIPNKMSSPENLVTLLTGLTNRTLLSDESTVLIFDMLDQGDKASNPLYQLAPVEAVIHDKQVTISTSKSMLGEIAVVEYAEKTYLMALFGFASDQFPVTFVGLAQSYTQIMQAFWEFVQSR